MKNKGLLLGLVIASFIGQGAVSQWAFPQWSKDYSPNKGDLSGLSGDQMLFALGGFREMLAGILWVRADAFFDQGNYDAILPMIRLVTILDPHQIDVYATGVWHIAYNFTDEQSRSDRRYLPAAVALGAEGAEKNDHTYEMFFETGWLWYHKIDDNYDRAVYWWEEAHKRDDIQQARRNILSNAYIRDGRLDKAMDMYKTLLDEAEKKFAKSAAYEDRIQRDTLESNYDNMIVRLAQRGNFAQQRGEYDRADFKYGTQPPYDVGFSGRVTVVEPRVIVVEGTWNVQPVGTRIRFVLRDADYPNVIPGGANWDANKKVNLEPPTGITYLQDGLFVKNQSFNRRIDMSRDPTMYPLLKKDYIVEFYYNTRSAPAHMQDKFGYNGEGLTDKNFLNTDIREGQRVVYSTLKLTQDQLLRVGEWSMSGKVPVVQTPNYVAVGEVNTDTFFTVPSLRDRVSFPGAPQPDPNKPPVTGQ